MRVNRWQKKRDAAARKSANQVNAKSRIRQERPAPDYPADRPSGRYANIVINFPWMRGNNTVHIAVDFAPRPHRIDQYLVDGEVVTLTRLCREILRRHFPQIKIDWN